MVSTSHVGQRETISDSLSSGCRSTAAQALSMTSLDNAATNRALALQVPPRRVCLADAVEHAAVLAVDVDAKGVVARHTRRAHIVDKNGHQKNVIVGHEVRSSWWSGRQFAELLHGTRGVPRSVSAHGVGELGPQSLVAGRKARQNSPGEILGRYKRPHTIGHVEYVLSHTNEHRRDEDGVGFLPMEDAEHVTQVVLAVCAVAVCRDNGLVLDAEAQTGEVGPGSLLAGLGHDKVQLARPSTR